jgi:transposase
MGVKRFKHRLREGIKADRTACINRIRGLLAEFGLVFPIVDDFKQFRNGAQFGAWIGLTPRQHSSGGKASLGGITKRGDTYLRTLLVQGAKSAVMTAHRRQDRISQWALALRERSGWQKAVVALANKNARILWAVMTRGEAFDANHLSVKPQGT